MSDADRRGSVMTRDAVYGYDLQIGLNGLVSTVWWFHNLTQVSRLSIAYNVMLVGFLL